MDEDELTELYHLRRMVGTLRGYMQQKRLMWAKRIETWPKSVEPESLAKNLVKAYDKLLGMMEE